MEHFVNEYQYTTDVIEESVGAWWSWKFKKGYHAMIIGVVLVFVSGLLLKNFVLLSLEAIPVLVMVILRVKRNGAIKNEKERVEVLYQKNVPLLHLELGTNIYLKTETGERRILFSEMEDVLETENLLVIMLKGSMNVALSKTGFIEGNAEECMKCLKEKMVAL